MTHASIPAEERAKLGLPDTLVRLSTGCEHQRDLVADLLEGLAAIEQARALRVAVTVPAYAHAGASVGSGEALPKALRGEGGGV